MNDENAREHKRKALEYLDQAQQATDLGLRQELVKLCQQELLAAVACRYDKSALLAKEPNRQTARRRSSDVAAAGPIAQA
jgi:hypothetical protein